MERQIISADVFAKIAEALQTRKGVTLTALELATLYQFAGESIDRATLAVEQIATVSAALEEMTAPLSGGRADVPAPTGCGIRAFDCDDPVVKGPGHAKRPEGFPDDIPF